MKIQMWGVDKVIPYKRNPRRNDDAVEKVAASIKEFGFKQPIVVDKDSVIIVGHTRLLAALRLGVKEVPVLSLQVLLALSKIFVGWTLWMYGREKSCAISD